MIEITDLSFSYTDEAVLQNINLSVKAGDFMILFGEDDAGKTTLLHTLIGLLKPQTGSLNLFGQPAGRLSAGERAWMRFVPDEVVIENMSAAAYFSLWRTVSPEYDRQLEDRLCEEFHITPQTGFLQMTYGENKAVQIIAALCARPRLLILDEPSNFLDDRVYRQFLRVLRDCHAEGMTILLATEKYADAGGFGNCYAYLKAGFIKKCAAIPIQDRRYKVVTIEGGDREVLSKYMNGYEEAEDHKICLYMEDMTKLPLILHRTGGRDFIVEETTLEEELDRDFSRWEPL